MRNKTKSSKQLPSAPTFFPGSTSLLFLYLLPVSGAGGQGMGVAVSSSHAVSATPSSSGGGLLTLCPSSSMGSSHGLRVGICSTMDLHGLQGTASPWSSSQAARESLLQRLDHLLPLILLWPWCLQSCFSHVVSLLYPPAFFFSSS